MSDEHYIEDRNLSVAWARALRGVTARGRSEISPLVVSATGFTARGDVEESSEIRCVLDEILTGADKATIETVANTIFPRSFWNPTKPRRVLFDRYRRVLPKLHRASPRGIYFERMISGGPNACKNQLEFVIGTYTKRKGARRSILQVGVFNPQLDHSAAALLGFPCLQHVTFAPAEGGLNVNGFYAMQYLVERAYGNYVGLCRLGQFVAHELGIRLARMTCFAGIAKLDIAKDRLSSVGTSLDAVLARRAKESASGLQ